jgi:hypothetical protein
MNVKEIMQVYLWREGYDGLCNQEQECGCIVDNLLTCDSCPGECRPGFKAFNDEGKQIIIFREGW